MTYNPMACFYLSSWDWCYHSLCESNSHSFYKSNHSWPTYDKLHTFLQDYQTLLQNIYTLT